VKALSTITRPRRDLPDSAASHVRHPAGRPHRLGPSPDSPGGGRWAQARRAAADLTPDAVEQIAQRVAALLRDRGTILEHPAGGLVDAAELARYFGVTRAWVYEHADELGAIRVGTGPRARLRFDLRAATAALRSRTGPHKATETPRTAMQVRGRRKRQPLPEVPLLPINPPNVRGIVSWLGHRRRGTGRKGT
jgi:hypothetical protein